MCASLELMVEGPCNEEVLPSEQIFQQADFAVQTVPCSAIYVLVEMTDAYSESALPV